MSVNKKIAHLWQRDRHLFIFLMIVLERKINFVIRKKLIVIKSFTSSASFLKLSNVELPVSFNMS